MPEDKKKNLFDKAVDAFSSRDEKQAQQEAEKAAEAARQTAAQAAKDKAVAEIQANQAKKQAEEAKKELEELKKKQQAEVDSKAAVEKRQKAYADHLAYLKAAKPDVKVIAEHTVKSGETLSHLSLKYYGSAVREYWMHIYEFNKDLIGDNPSMVREGLTLSIPELPEEMKK